MKKKALTLIEVMIVIFLITLITGAIGYNMKGSMDAGRRFRSEQAKEQLHDLLLIALDEGGGKGAESIANDPEAALRRTGLAKDPGKLILDGWGEKFDVKAAKSGKDFDISSKNLDKYLQVRR